MKIHKKHLHSFVISLIVLVFLIISSFVVSNEINADSDMKELSGYAWSGDLDENGNLGGVGWISMNCKNTDNCDQSNYKVTLDESTGELSGYAWTGHEYENNIGWLQFGGLDTTKMPDGTGTEKTNAYIDDDGNLKGWARFLSYGDDKFLGGEVSSSSVVEGYSVTSEYYLPCNTEQFYNDFVENLSDNIQWLRSYQIDGCGKWYSGYNPTLGKDSPVDKYHSKTSVTDGENITLISKYYLNRDENGDNQNDKTLVQQRVTDTTTITYTSILDSGRTGGSFCDLNLSSLVALGDMEIMTYVNGVEVNTDPNDPHFNLISVDPDSSETVTSLINPIIDGVDCGTIRVILKPVLGSGHTDGNSHQLAWDGWVSLSGTTDAGGSYGPTRSGNDLSGGEPYAWGGDNVVGWIDFSGVTIDDATAQCGSINNTIVDSIPNNDLCTTGDPTEVSQVDQNTWDWHCIVDELYLEDEYPNSQCAASCEEDEWICGDSCIPITETCGDDGCPNGREPDPVTGECVPITVDPTPSATISQFEADPRIINPGKSCNLEWFIETDDTTLISCEITSDDPNDSNLPLNLQEHVGETIGISGETLLDNNVDTTTEYTLTCSDKETSSVIDSQTTRCIINPNFLDF